MPDDYEVGYKRPPRHSRFKPGVSGNPKGRPAGAKGRATLLQEELQARVTIKENGKRRSVTKLELAIRQLTNKAASGDLRALIVLLAEVRMLEAGEAAQADDLERPLHPDDEAVLRNFIAKYKRVTTNAK